jgi:hypothetical protein
VNSDHIITFQDQYFPEKCSIFIITIKEIIIWNYETKEEMNQEFEWIMSKLNVVQNIPATVIDNRSTRISKDHLAWDYANHLGSSKILDDIYSMVDEAIGKEINIIVTPDELHWITDQRIASHELSTILGCAVSNCERAFNKTVSFQIGK